MQEAELAKEKMHGKLVYGRPVVVRLASEKNLMESSKASKSIGETSNSNLGFAGQSNKSAKIAAIKNKLKAMEEERHVTKKPKQADDTQTRSTGSAENPQSLKDDGS